MSKFIEVTDTEGKQHFLNTSFISHITENGMGQAVFHIKIGDRLKVTCPVTLEMAKKMVSQ